jgi:hypothetical protein
MAKFAQIGQSRGDGEVEPQRWTLPGPETTKGALYRAPFERLVQAPDPTLAIRKI